MTDNDIIKALEEELKTALIINHRFEESNDTENPDDHKFIALLSNTLDLIKRQQAEIENLKETIRNHEDKEERRWEREVRNSSKRGFLQLRRKGRTEMTFVSCKNTDCKHCDDADFHCTKLSIFVGDGFDCGCRDLDPYYNSAEYGEKYYKCVKTKNGELGKCVSYGKRIEYRGRVFYTFDRITDYGEYMLTDAETGYRACMHKQLEQRFDALCEKAKSIPNVESLPLAEWDNGGYILANTDGERKEK